MKTKKIEAQALHLPKLPRARLAQKLIESLDEENEVEKAWAKVAEQRYQELKSGTEKSIPADQVFAEIRSNQSKI